MKGKAKDKNRRRGKRQDVAAAVSSTLSVVYPDAAGIDIGGSEHWVCVPADRDARPVRPFGSCTADHEALAKWLSECRIRQVAMEATGVYWTSLFELLERHGFEVMLVNGRQTRQVAGRKSDVLDCQWIQQLMTFGLLSGSYRPAEALCAVRAVVRLRSSLVRDAARAGQHMDKALVQMNVQLGRMLSDLTGKSGLAIIRAIVEGQRDRQVLAALCDTRVKASPEQIGKSLEGTWREEHLLALKQALARYDLAQTQILQCDEQIQAAVAKLQRIDDVMPVMRHATRQSKHRRAPSHAALRGALFQAFGVDLTAIPTIDVDIALVIFSEIGPDLSRFPTSQHFCAWLNLAPGTRISGGKRLGRVPMPAVNRAGEALKQAATSARNTTTFIGAAHRARLARMPKCCAVKATAHQLARLIYAMLTRGQAYVEHGIEQFEAERRLRQMRQLRRTASRLGVKIIANAT